MKSDFLTSLFRKKTPSHADKQVKTITEGFEGLSLYYRNSCPFCRYVLSFMKANDLTIELRDISSDASHQDTLIQEGGKRQVPCLRMEKNGVESWMYESADIVEYLKKLQQ